MCVFRLLGTPTKQDWPGMAELPDYAKITFPTYPPVQFRTIFPNASEDAVDLVSTLLVFNSKKRMKAVLALTHNFFMSHPLPAKLYELPKIRCRPPKKPLNLEYDPCIPIEQSLTDVAF